MSGVVGKLDKVCLSVSSFKSRVCEQGFWYRYLFGGDPGTGMRGEIVEESH